MATQDTINIGQKRINGMLCQVDWRLLAALLKVYETLQKCCPDADLSELHKALAEATKLNEAVAREDPPGCDPVNPKGPIG